MNKSKNIDPNDFEPKRFALDYNQSKIYIEYEVPSTKKMYHYKIRLNKISSESNIDEVIKDIHLRHSNIFDTKKIKEDQFYNLVEKLMSYIQNKNKVYNFDENMDNNELNNNELENNDNNLSSGENKNFDI